MDPLVSKSSVDALTVQLHALHERVQEIAPDIQRIACALYDADEDMLGTFINSTDDGVVLRGYQYPLANSESLSTMARTLEPRLLTDLQNQLQADTPHSAYVLEEGYQSSYTLPLTHQGAFLGFLFFDSRKSDTFTVGVRREVNLYGQVIAMTIANAVLAVRSIVSSVMLARDFASFRDAETGGHLRRMARYSRIIARGLSFDDPDVSDEFVEHLFLYAPLHDIGKIAIPDAVLLKPGPLNDAEWEIMKSHTVRGREIVDTIVNDLGVSELPNQSLLNNIVELHHEAINGGGYPFGLRGDDIPLESRIVSVADVYDALTSRRPYKQPWPTAQAFAELERMVEIGKLDARCVRVLIDSEKDAEHIRTTYLE